MVKSVQNLQMSAVSVDLVQLLHCEAKKIAPFVLQ